jgi:hypothetical protein
MKKGKELKVNDFKDYNVTYGSVNNKNPKALYITVSSWAQPRWNENLNYSRIIRDIDKTIRQTIYNELDSNFTSPFYKDRTIIDFDIRESGIKYGKRSFTNAEITLYMKHEIPANSEELKPVIEHMINLIIKTVFEKNKHLKFYRKKK